SEVTSVSGRGVGMDVVRTNIEKIGGVIEVGSVDGVGTRFTIRIPLTLTIVSALIVECCGDRFAMPQSSIVELVSASGGSGRTVEYIDGAAVLRLRNRLLPLISLQTLLGLEAPAEPSSETCIVVARVGAFTFGVIVDRVFDTEEIVVKPVASVLRHIKVYSGATILGDGSVILILDLKGISVETGALQSGGALKEDTKPAQAVETVETADMLVFRSANDSLKAAPLASVSRIEEVSSHQIEEVDGRTVVQYRGKLMPIVVADAAPAPRWEGGASRPLLVFARDDRAVGLLVNEIVDIVESTVAADLKSLRPGTLGSLIIDGAATELIDVAYYWRSALGEDLATETAPSAPSEPQGQSASRLLLIDHSPFAHLLLRPLLSQAGYEVTVAANAAAALTLYQAGESFKLIMADFSNASTARAFADAFAQAEGWHATPLLSLAMHDPVKPASSGYSMNQTHLLDVVAEQLGDLRGAA
ncbi:MAG: hybrid sensor histidine kinase/response regulator, partial [Caulobacteraceae bacterium]